LCYFALLLLFPCASGAEAQGPGDDAKAWLRHLDGRIYTPPPLDALSFRFRPLYPGEDGGSLRPAPYLVAYAWRRTSGDRVDLLGVDPEKNELAPLRGLPGFSAEQFDKARQDFRQVARNLAAIVRGMSLTQRYREWNGRIRKVRINDAAEIRIVLEPKKLHRLTRVVIHLNRNRVPWKLDKTYRGGERVVQHEEYKRRDEGLIIVKMSRTHTPAHPSQPSFDTGFILTWHTVSGVLLPASIQRVGKELPAIAQGKTELTAMRINKDVSAFKVMPAPKKTAK
jgi:hypothetical protein